MSTSVLIQSLLLSSLLHVTQACRLAAESAEIKQTGAAYLRGTDQIDLVDHLGMERENALHAVSETHLPDSKAGLRAIVALDHDAFKSLKALFVAFLDLHVNTDRVAGTERRDIGALGLRQQF